MLRRFDCLLAPTKAKALTTFNEYKGKPESIIRSKMQSATGYPFYNLSKLELAPSQKGRNSLLDDPSNLAPNLNSYLNGYSLNIRAIFDHFKFGEQITKIAEKNLLFQVIQKFATFDLSFVGLSTDQAAMQMGYVFEELIRIGAEQSNEEAGEHFTPREVIKLMVNLLLSPEQDLRRSHVVKTIYDPACGTGGMLSVAEKYIRDLNSEAKPHLYGQDWNDEAWAVCRSDMLIKGEDADNIAMGDTFTKDFHKPKDPDYIGDITGLHGQFQEGASRWVLFDKDGKVVTVTTSAPTGVAPEGQQWKQLVVSKVFDNEDFGYHKITVERPLRLNFHATSERLARLDDETAFKILATSAKKDEAARLVDIVAGGRCQQQIRDLLAEVAKRHPEQINDCKVFLDRLKPIDRELNVRLSAPELKAVVSALSERDEAAEICCNRDDEGEPDAELRDTENVPLKESIQAYFEREVLPHVPDAWIDHSKTKVGYEIPLNRHLYRYEPPRELSVIEGEIKVLEAEIVRLLGEVTA